MKTVTFFILLFSCVSLPGQDRHHQVYGDTTLVETEFLTHKGKLTLRVKATLAMIGSYTIKHTPKGADVTYLDNYELDYFYDFVLTGEQTIFFETTFGITSYHIVCKDKQGYILLNGKLYAMIRDNRVSYNVDSSSLDAYRDAVAWNYAALGLK